MQRWDAAPVGSGEIEGMDVLYVEMAMGFIGRLRAFMRMMHAPAEARGEATAMSGYVPPTEQLK